MDIYKYEFETGITKRILTYSSFIDEYALERCDALNSSEHWLSESFYYWPIRVFGAIP